jgi:hypothetical protein
VHTEGGARAILAQESTTAASKGSKSSAEHSKSSTASWLLMSPDLSDIIREVFSHQPLSLPIL